MPEMILYEHGVPSWIDLGAPDLPAAVTFYRDLFGWEAEDMGEEAGHYTIMSKRGRQVAALNGAEDPGPPRWTTYVNVMSVDAVASLVEASGGSVVVAPMDVMTQGRMAIFKDPTGAFIAAWQAGDHRGAQLVNEPGAFTWSELMTADLSRSKEFYTSVFDWGWGGSDDYAEAQVSGRTIGGAMPRREDIPADVPDNWLVYFGAADVDVAGRKAVDLGATLLVEPTDIPGTGRFCVVMDPQGATFGLFS